MILKDIVNNKKQEVKRRKRLFGLNKFRSELEKSDRDFKSAITRKGINLIAEIKKKSPSKGKLIDDALSIARLYDRSAAVAISVVTDEKFFGGNLMLLRRIRKLTKKPLLRKDFIIDDYQIYESRYYGADAVLLIARILDKETISNFIKIAHSLDMDCLVEVHDEKDLKKMPKNAEIIGINNRDLDNLKIDLQTTINLSKLIHGKVIVAESGYETKEQIPKVNAVLIGTSLLRSGDINKKINELA